MSSPTFSDALSYVVDAQAEILSAVADWKSYADAAAEAYSQAYEDQGRVLGSVNKRLESRSFIQPLFACLEEFNTISHILDFVPERHPYLN